MTPNNVLVLGPPNSGKIRVSQYLTKDLDVSTLQSETHSGLVYNFDLRTKYYTLNVNLLIEEYPDSRTLKTTADLSELLNDFYEEFKAPQFLELREALDGLVFTLGPDLSNERQLEDCISVMCKIRELLEPGDIFCIVVAVVALGTDLEAVEDAFMSSGLEFVNFHELGKNEYNEAKGRDRLLEVLSSHDWSHQVTPVSDTLYRKNKMDNVQAMSKSFVGSERDSDDLASESGTDRGVDLTQMLSLLKIAKEKAEGMSMEQKKAYVDELVEEYINYI